MNSDLKERGMCSMTVERLLAVVPVIASAEPNRLAVSPAMMSFLTSGGTDSTMLEFFLENNTMGIREISEAPELTAIGPSGEDGILFYRDDTDTADAAEQLAGYAILHHEPT